MRASEVSLRLNVLSLRAIAIEVRVNENCPALAPGEPDVLARTGIWQKNRQERRSSTPPGSYFTESSSICTNSWVMRFSSPETTSITVLPFVPWKTAVYCTELDLPPRELT
jgi:hypothetical protein